MVVLFCLHGRLIRAIQISCQQNVTKGAHIHRGIGVIDGRVAAAVKKFTMNTSHALILGVMVFASAFHIGHYIIGTESTLRNWLWLDIHNTYLSWPRHDGDFIIVDDELIRRRLHTSMRKGSFNATYPNIAHFFNHIPKVSKVICAYPLLFILNKNRMTLLLLVYLDRGILCMLLTEPNG